MLTSIRLQDFKGHRDSTVPLTAEDADREARCLTEAPLDRLRDRGEHSGLRAFLDEVKTRIIPLCIRSS